MKWLPFFILILVCSCRQTNTRKQPESIKYTPPQEITDAEYVFMLVDTWDDSGYFRGYTSKRIDELERTDSSNLFLFLSGILSKKRIVLLSDKTLSHTVFIDKGLKTRFDTLRNDQCTITSVFKFGEGKQKIVLNGNILRSFTDTVHNIFGEDHIDFDEESFRHFSFAGKEYYYLEAATFYTGASMGNIKYHLVYDVKNKHLNGFETCRFKYSLFGDVDGDDRLDYLDFNNSDFCTAVPWSDNVIIQLYSCNDQGRFVLQKRGNKPYFIKGNTGDNFSQDSFIVKRYKWPKPLK